MSIISRNTKRSLAILIPIAFITTYFAVSSFTADDKWFVEHSLPLKETYRLFDVGIVDANDDGVLDIYTSNHHFRQALLIADGKGGYRDALSEWGLDQSPEFPLAELSFATPKVDKAGVYVFWRGTNLIIRAHRTNEIGQWQGSIHTYDPVKVVKHDGGEIEKHEHTTDAVTETTLEFGLNTDGVSVLTPGGQGLPIDFDFRGELRPEQIFVGLGKVSPSTTSFSLAMRDRHALAWADFNDDGVLDVFINRGALGGKLKAHTPEVASKIKDELFLSQDQAEFVEAASRTGIQKKACSGRHAKWIDFNQDGLLDLFINCYDRENAAVSGDFPKQLYRQVGNKALVDVAEVVGLGLPDQQMGNLVWFDVDSDSDPDLLAFQDEGLFLYRNENGLFVKETVLPSKSSPGEKIGHTTDSAWFFDGKLTLSDYDTDGDLDVFASSKRGNVLLRNHGGKFDVVDPTSLGLPAKSATANWVDYDNDGLPDLHLVPQGLYRQRQDQSFEKTGLLAFEPAQYQAAVVNWFDLDNDGRLDVLMALDPYAGFKRWWEFFKAPKRKSRSEIVAYRNVGATNHWIQISLAGIPGNQQAIGTQVTVTTPDGMQIQEVGSTEGSFFSQGHYRLYFGLGSNATVDTIDIRWPDGVHQQLHHVNGDQLVKIERKPNQSAAAESHAVGP